LGIVHQPTVRVAMHDMKHPALKGGGSFLRECFAAGSKPVKKIARGNNRKPSTSGRLMFMKHLVIIGILLAFLPPSAPAANKYITDVEITLRTGQGTDHKILALVKSGQEVAVLEEGDEWTRVRLPNGIEGWVVSRFLTDEKPSGILLEELRQKHEALLAHADAPLKEIMKLQEANKTLRFELASREKALNELKISYEALQKESDELLKVQSDYNKLTSQLAKQKEKADKIEDELLNLEQRQIFRWILVGAGVLFVGFITGFSARRQRRRPSLL